MRGIERTMYELLNLIVAIGVPSAVMAYIFRRFEQRQDKKEQEVEEKTDKQELGGDGESGAAHPGRKMQR